MKLVLKYTKFNFTDTDTNNKYEVICPNGQGGSNEFNVCKNGNLIAGYTIRHGGVNKTQAKRILQKALNEKPKAGQP